MKIPAGRRPGMRGDRIHVRHDVDDDGLVHRDRPRQRVAQLPRFLDAYSGAAEGFRHFREIHFRKPPHLFRAPALLAAVCDVVQLDLLVERAVVVHDDHRVDVVAPRGFELADVVVETAVPGKAHYGAVRCSALHAQRGREAPPQRAGGAIVALSRMAQLDETCGPDAGVSGVRYDDAVRRQRIRDFLADALGTNGRHLGVAHLRIFGAPIRNQLLYAPGPLAGRLRRLARGGFYHAPEGRLRIAQHRYGIGIVSA